MNPVFPFKIKSNSLFVASDRNPCNLAKRATFYCEGEVVGAHGILGQDPAGFLE